MTAVHGRRLVLIVAASAVVLSCGGGGGSPVPSFSVSGTVTGLAGSGLVLQNNGGDNLGIISNGSFTFSATVASGSAYHVTVHTHPASSTPPTGSREWNGAHW